MAKDIWKPGTMIYPAPPVIVTCGASPEEWNMITVAWTGTVCTNPAMCVISVRPERFSFPIIERCMEFTINLTTADMARATDLAGCRSGRDTDKWKLTGLTPEPGHLVKSPCIAESPLAIECRVARIESLGSHVMILGEVLCLRPEESLIDPADGAFRLDSTPLCAYSHGRYYELGRELGRFGFSVRKKQ